MPCALIGSLKYAASPTSAQPGPADRRTKPWTPAQPCWRVSRVAPSSRPTSPGAARLKTASNVSRGVRTDRSARIRSGVVPTKTQLSPSLVGMMPAAAPLAYAHS